MDRSREYNAPGLTVSITYTAYNFEHCQHTLVEYSNDLIIQNRAMGTEITRNAVELAFKKNVEDIYAEGSVMRQELLEQLNCPCVSNYWEKRRRPAAFLVYMRNDVLPYGFLPRSSSDINRNISAMLQDDNTRIELPYLGLRDLRQLRYMDLVSKVRISRLGRDAGTAPEPTMAHVWKTVIMNVFWFEDSELKEEKLREAYTKEVRRYWKLIEYADFVKLNPLVRHVAPINGGNNSEKVNEKQPLSPATAHSQSRIQSDTTPVESDTVSLASARQPTAREELGYFPSMAAHSAHAQPHISDDDSENSRLRKAVIEHKATIQDLSARLVKAKMSETQKRKHSARETRDSHIKAPRRQESELPAKIQPQTLPATQSSIPIKHNQDLRLEETVPLVPHPFWSHALPPPSRRDVQNRQQMEQFQSLMDAADRLLAWRPWEQPSEPPDISAFDIQLAQVDGQWRGNWTGWS